MNLENGLYLRGLGLGPHASPLISFRDLVRILRQYQVQILLAAVAGGLAGYLAGYVLPRSYIAEGLLVVETQELSIPELQTVTSQSTVEPWGARSAARVLTSRANIERAVVALDLENDPELREAVGPASSTNLQAKIVEEVAKRLTADSEERSYAIELSYRGRDPDSAPAILNAIMNTYVHDEVEAKQAATRRASERLKARLDQIWAEWQTSNEAIRAMERDHGLVQTADGTVTSQAMAALALERVRLRAERARAVADRAQIVAAIQDGSLNVINPELVSPRLRSLWEQEAALRIRRAELGAELGERHPQMVALRRDIADLEVKLLTELNNIRSSLDQHIATLQQRDDELGQAIVQADQEASAAAEGRVLLEQLTRQAEMKGELYAQYRGRYEQTVAALEMQTADVRIASPAVPPERPSSPGPNLLGAVGGGFGLLLASSIIVLRRWLHDRFESLEELSGITGIAGLGALPQTTSLLHPRRKMSELVVQEPDSSIAETVRGILLRIQYLRRDGPVPNVLLVTSPSPTDGKTSLVVTMARVAARDRLKCLAIDCDFRRPGLADVIDAEPKQWLSDFIVGEDAGSYERLATPEKYSDAHYILTRPVRPMSRWVLDSPRLKAIVDGARERYDLVLIDSPPIMNVADPMILARLADAFVMVVSARGSDRAEVLEAVHRAEITGVPVAGLVMSRVGSDIGDPYSYKGYPSARG